MKYSEDTPCGRCGRTLAEHQIHKTSHRQMNKWLKQGEQQKLLYAIMNNNSCDIEDCECGEHV